MTGRHAAAVHKGRGAKRTAVRVGLLALGGLAGAAAVGAWWGIVAGLAAGWLCDRRLSHQPTRAGRARERQFMAELPFAVDLVSAALRAGSPPVAAVSCIAEAVGGEVGRRLHEVHRLLSLGAPAVRAWAVLGEDEAAGRVTRAAARSGDTGAALAAALARVADDLRSDALLGAQTRAGSAGVLVVLPLGLCFLPAFVLTGLVPVIVAVVGGVLRSLP